MYDEKQDICIVRASPQKILINYKGENIYFKVEKLGRHHPSYVNKGTTSTNKTYPHKRYGIIFVTFLPKMQNLNPITRKHQTYPN